MAQKKYADALPRLNTVLAADPRNLVALRYRVTANLSLARFAEARTDVDTLLRIKPNDGPLLVAPRAGGGLIQAFANLRLRAGRRCRRRPLC